MGEIIVGLGLLFASFVPFHFGAVVGAKAQAKKDGAVYAMPKGEDLSKPAIGLDVDGGDNE